MSSHLLTAFYPLAVSQLLQWWWISAGQGGAAVLDLGEVFQRVAGRRVGMGVVCRGGRDKVPIHHK